MKRSLPSRSPMSATTCVTGLRLAVALVRGKTQCAAVRTLVGATSDPPQRYVPAYSPVRVI